MKPRLLTMILLLALPSTASAAPLESFTEPFRKIDISPCEPGIIDKIAVAEGDVVVEGQVLATLENNLLKIALEITQAGIDARGRVDSAVAERDLRKLRLAKLQELRGREHASQDEVDRAAADLAIAEANLLSTKEQQELATLEHKKTAAMIERRIIRSPINGVVTRIYHEEHEFISTTAPTVMTLAQLDPLRITFSVPTTEATMLKVGQKVPVAFPETGEIAQGRVELVSPVTDAESGTVRVKVLLANPKGEYRCGARCDLELQRADTTMYVPKQ